MLDAFTVEDGCLYISLGFNLDLAVIHILYMLIYFKNVMSSIKFQQMVKKFENKEVKRGEKCRSSVVLFYP